jgi:threonine dehydratase
MITVPGIDEIRAAAGRTRGYVQRTPLLAATPIKERRELAGGLRLKLETLQVTGSFKARGAINAVFALPPTQLRRGIVTASGGNHGLAVAYAGWAAGVPATIFLPRSVAAELSGAAAVAALLSGCYGVTTGEYMCAIVCGAGTDGIH